MANYVSAFCGRTRATCEMSYGRARMMRRSSERSGPQSGGSRGATVWPKASGKPCAGCPRSGAEFRRLPRWVSSYAAGNFEIGDPDDITRIQLVIVIDDKKDVHRDGFRGSQCERLARLERPQT